MADTIYTTNTSFYTPRFAGYAPSKLASLVGYRYPGDTEPITAKFGTDSFLPDFTQQGRYNRVQLIKGAAIQHSAPAETLQVIDIVGWCASRKDKNIIMMLFYSNLPGLPAPYPTDYLKIRRDYYMLNMPDGRSVKVRFAATPTFGQERGERGTTLHTITSMKFNPVIEEDDEDLY